MDAAVVIVEPRNANTCKLQISLCKNVHRLRECKQWRKAKEKWNKEKISFAESHNAVNNLGSDTRKDVHFVCNKNAKKTKTMIIWIINKKTEFCFFFPFLRTIGHDCIWHAHNGGREKKENRFEFFFYSSKNWTREKFVKCNKTVHLFCVNITALTRDSHSRIFVVSFFFSFSVLLFNKMKYGKFKKKLKKKNSYFLLSCTTNIFCLI